jgi:hypothetical protein
MTVYYGPLDIDVDWLGPRKNPLNIWYISTGIQQIAVRIVHIRLSFTMLKFY